MVQLTELEIALARRCRHRRLGLVRVAAYSLLIPLSFAWGEGVSSRGADSITGRSFYSQAQSDIIGRSVTRTTSRRPRRSAGLDHVRFERTQKYAALIDHYSRRNALDPHLVRAVIYTESGGDAAAASPQGAVGLMQLMPRTARDLGVSDRTNPEQNIAGGTEYLRTLFERFGFIEVALWAYNAGPAAVVAGRVPEETRSYVPQVMRVRKLFAAQIPGSRMQASMGHRDGEQVVANGAARTVREVMPWR